MRGPDALERSQKDLFLAIKSELALFEKRKTKDLKSYERKFRASIPKSGRVAGKPDLIRAIRRANVVLVGDFHPFRQSQKGFLRLLNESIAGLPRPVVALECVQQSHQSIINEFLTNLITIEELREKIEFEKYWPFPWENYCEILVWAKSMKMPVLALNILDKKRGPSALRARDHAAAEIISQEILAHKDSVIFVLYGELHLARPHLPHGIRLRLGRKARNILVHQNNPDLYWKTPKLRNGQRPEILRLASDEYCIFNSVPWVKLCSYLDWLEGNPGADHWEEGFDAPGTIHHYAHLLAEAIGVPANFREDVEIITPDRLLAGAKATSLSKIKPVDRPLARHAMEFQRTDFLPASGVLILPTLSTNSLSEAAAYLLWHSQRALGTKAEKQSSQSWMANFLVGYIGSKVLNPKRKCNEVEDIKELLFSLRKRSPRNSAKAAVLARSLSLLRPYLRGEKLPLRSRALAGPREIEACRLAGFILGERFFLSLMVDPGLISILRDWFHCNSPRAARALLAETSKKIDRASISPASKKDRF